MEQNMRVMSYEVTIDKLKITGKKKKVEINRWGQRLYYQSFE